MPPSHQHFWVLFELPGVSSPSGTFSDISSLTPCWSHSLIMVSAGGMVLIEVSEPQALLGGSFPSLTSISHLFSCLGNI